MKKKHSVIKHSVLDSEPKNSDIKRKMITDHIESILKRNGLNEDEGKETMSIIANSIKEQKNKIIVNNDDVLSDLTLLQKDMTQ